MTTYINKYMILNLKINIYKLTTNKILFVEINIINHKNKNILSYYIHISNKESIT